MQQALFSELLRKDNEQFDLVNDFVRGLPREIEALARMARDGDWAQMKDAAYELKCACTDFGYPPLAGIADVMESCLKENQQRKARMLVGDLKILLRFVQQGIKQS